jgi:1-acyl-sn-glycerol-3-phosphate acyltransferase
MTAHATVNVPPDDGVAARVLERHERAVGTLTATRFDTRRVSFLQAAIAPVVFGLLTGPLAVMSFGLRVIEEAGLAPSGAWKRFGAASMAWTARRCLRVVLGMRVTADAAACARPIMIVANHGSWLDCFILAARYRCTFVATRELWRRPIVGLLVRAFGVIPLEEGARESLLDAQSMTHEWLDNGVSVAVFPEGSVGINPVPDRFRSAFFQVPIDRQEAVHPVAIRYLDEGQARTKAATRSLRLMVSGSNWSALVLPSQAIQSHGLDRTTLATATHHAVLEQLGFARPVEVLHDADDEDEELPSSVLDLLAKVSDAAPIAPTATLSDLGIDSLSMAHLAVELRTRQRSAELPVLGPATTVAEIAASLPDSTEPGPGPWFKRDYPWLGLSMALILPLAASAPWMGSAVVTWWSLGQNWAAWRVALAPLVFISTFAIVAGISSIPFHWAIRPGRMPASVAVPLYAARRVYGCLWTSVYYCKPVYAFVLGVRPLRALVFRLFGYSGCLDFTVFPDTWIRDLPILRLGRGAYVANRSTLGTNVMTDSGEVLVGTIRLGAAAQIGHLSVIGPDTTVGRKSVIGAVSQVGMGVRIGNRVRLGPCCSVEHHTSIGDGSVIESNQYVPVGSHVAIANPASAREQALP